MIQSEMMSYLRELNGLSIFVRLLFATLFGFVIGVDRTRKHRPAGFRTYMLVCVGAAMVMITNQYICQMFGANDPARMGAQVVSGIGFLGAGTIIVTRQLQVTGMTTAASLWASACIGLAIGIGFYEAALLGAFFIGIIVMLLVKFDRWLQARSRVMEMYVEFETSSRLTEFLAYAVDHDFKVYQVDMAKSKTDASSVAAVLTVRIPKRVEKHYLVLEEFRTVEGLVYIEEL
jgi:Uncharacterized membrane protein